jgi:two-component system sensor histidine kinase MtrB
MSQIVRFESLLADLIEVSRFDARAAILETQGFDITSLVRRVIDELHASDDVRVFSPDESVIAQVDARRIERILRNLIANAIDHSEGRGVVVTIAESDDAVSVGVRDHGIGFTERDGERLFDRFWRADPSRSRLRGGTGLGLSIAIDDARLHQGTIAAWGRPNLGAHFVLSIPKSPGIPMTIPPIEVIPSDAPSTEFTTFDIDDV